MPDRHGRGVPTLLLSIACGVIAANLYYLQPLGAPVAGSIGLSAKASGLFASMTQIGYGIGLIGVVPLADLKENRRLVAVVLWLSVAATVTAALTSSAPVLVAATLLIGLGSVGVQLVVVYAAHLAGEAERGRVIGAVTAGLMLGIMASRPMASAVAALASWRIVLAIAAILTGAIALRLWQVLPERAMPASETWRRPIGSLPGLLRHNPPIRWRMAIHVNLFFGFGLFWTVTPLGLADRFGLSQDGIALFALTGIASVLAAPLAGRVADRGGSQGGTALAIGLVAAGFVCATLGTRMPWGVWALGVAAVLIGAGVTAHAVFAQRDVFGADPAVRARLNGVFMAAYFTAGALGSALAGVVYVRDGWAATYLLSLFVAMLAMGAFLVRR